jgi:hypothetical protein
VLSVSGNLLRCPSAPSTGWASAAGPLLWRPPPSESDAGALSADSIARETAVRDNDEASDVFDAALLWFASFMVASTQLM